MTTETPTELPAEKVNHARLLAALAVFFLLVYLVPLGSRPMASPDEPRYGEIPREMLADGDWVTPRLCGVPYFEKTALGYQTTAASFWLFGENRFALRLPNALAVGLTALFLYFFLIKTCRDPYLPALASALYLTSAFVVALGMFAVPDAQLTAAITISIGCFYLACLAKSKSGVLLWLVLSGIACGAAFQIKGFLAFAVPVLVLTTFLCWTRSWKRLFLYPWIPLGIAGLVSLPWGLAIHRAEPDFWRYFVMEEHIRRFLSGTYDKGSETIFYFVPILIFGLLPAGGTAICAWSGWRRKGFFAQPLARLLLCWIVMPFLFFSASSCKTGPYILPCFPPAAAFLALGIREAFRRDRQKAQQRMGVFFYGFGILTAVLSAMTLLAFPLPYHEWFPGFPNLYPEGYALGFVCMPLLVLWGILLMVYRKKTIAAFVLYFLGLAPILSVLFFVLPIGLFGAKFAEYGLRKGLEQIPVQADDTVFVEGNHAPAYAWTLKRTNLVYVNPSGELRHWFSRAGDSLQKPFFFDENTEALQPLLKESPEKKSILITSRDLNKQPFPFPREPIAQFTFSGITIVRF